MATPDSFMGGLIAAVVGCLFTIILFFGVALPAEKFVATMEDTTIYDVPEDWASYDNIVFWMNMMYVAISLPAIVGIITMFLSAIKTQQYDVIADPEPEQVPQYISQEELQYNVR